MKYKAPKIIRDKKKRKESGIKFWKEFLFEGGLFLITSLLAIVSAFELNKLVLAKKAYLPTTTLQDFLFSFLLVTFIVLIFVLFKKAKKFKEVIYKGLFIITVFWGGMTVLNLFIPVFGAIFLMGVLIILWLKVPTIWVHDILIALGLAGASCFFGLSFAPSVALSLLLIFSVYDFIAVYKTKHMIVMAKEMIEKKVIMGFIIPKDFKVFNTKLKDLKIGDNVMILGGGDVVFPGLLAVSVVPFGFLKAFIIVFFSLAGTFFTYWLFTAQKEIDGHIEPIPALPPVALFAIIGYFATLLLP